MGVDLCGEHPRELEVQCVFPVGLQHPVVAEDEQPCGVCGVSPYLCVEVEFGVATDLIDPFAVLKYAELRVVYFLVDARLEVV